MHGDCQAFEHFLPLCLRYAQQVRIQVFVDLARQFRQLRRLALKERFGIFLHCLAN